MKKKYLLLWAMPALLLTACTQDKKPETKQTDALTEEKEASDPHVRAQEYETGTQDDLSDTIPPVVPDTVN
jgi:outer membrane biogenesis lipoprotein LolB